MSRSRSMYYSSYKAVYHVLGDNLRWVIPLIILIGWFTDSLLSIFQQLFQQGLKEFDNDKNIQNLLLNLDFQFNLSMLVFCIIAIFFITHMAKKSIPSDRYKTIAVDKNRNQREILIQVISGYFPYQVRVKNEDGSDINSLPYSELLANLSDLPSGMTIPELSKTKFNSNWLPSLNAINHYKNLKEVIILTTDGEKGAHNQVDLFRKFVNQYLSSSGRKIKISTYLDPDYMKNNHLKELIDNGIPSNDLTLFAETALEVIRNIESKHPRSHNIQDKIAVDVTSGKASMSAVLSAVSCSQDIFIHYTDTDTMLSHELDITAS
jgi:hypothetical protein